MSYQLRHDWANGPHLPSGTSIATCRHCGILRAVSADEGDVYIARTRDPKERVRFEEPPCIEQSGRLAGVTTSAQRERERAHRDAVRAAPDHDAPLFAKLPGFPDGPI